MSVAASPSRHFLSRERSIAAHGFNRWLVPPAALAVHLCIGMAYGFSVFWLPLSRAVGGAEPKACPADMGFFASIFATSCDWKISMLGWTFTLFFVFLGSSAAVFGHWLETAGPRKAGLAASVCWCGGLLISAAGVYLHQIWMLWLGSGVIGGIGLGLGYISPVSTLIKWFPDRRGMATGMAIMGFGGGAMIGAPLADKLMAYYRDARPPSACGRPSSPWRRSISSSWSAARSAIACRATAGSRRAGRRSATAANKMVTSRHVHLDVAWKTPQFWLLWGVLCLNVSAGIGVLGMASPMLQEVFGGTAHRPRHRLCRSRRRAEGEDRRHRRRLHRPAQPLQHRRPPRSGPRGPTCSAARRPTPSSSCSASCSIPPRPGPRMRAMSLLFVLFFCVILSMYGGGFATIPAYLADIFGTHYVGAIHGRLLTAWSTAGVLGPVLVNYLRDYQIDHGVAREAVYNQTMYILAGLLVVGLICDLAVRPVAEKLFMTDEEVAAEKKTSVAAVVQAEEEPHADFEDYVEDGQAAEAAAAEARRAAAAQNGGSRIVLIAAWAAVGIPLAWGVSITLQKTFVLFH